MHISLSDDRPLSRGTLNELYATAICGNDLTSSVLYVIGVTSTMAGQLAPLCLLLVGFVLYLFKSVYGEVPNKISLAAHHALCVPCIYFNFVSLPLHLISVASVQCIFLSLLSCLLHLYHPPSLSISWFYHAIRLCCSTGVIFEIKHPHLTLSPGPPRSDHQSLIPLVPRPVQQSH